MSTDVAQDLTAKPFEAKTDTKVEDKTQELDKKPTNQISEKKRLSLEKARAVRAENLKKQKAVNKKILEMTLMKPTEEPPVVKLIPSSISMTSVVPFLGLFGMVYILTQYVGFKNNMKQKLSDLLPEKLSGKSQTNSNENSQFSELSAMGLY